MKEKVKGVVINSLRMPKIFSSGCVLQQGEKTRIWGWSVKDDRITLSFQGKQEKSATDENGRWEAKFRFLNPGGPFYLKVESSTGETIILNEVYVGEVFFCSGQSNMELPMNRVKERYPEEFLVGPRPEIRIFKVEEDCDFHDPLTDHKKASWKGVTPDTIGDISAVSYFFGQFLYEDLGVPLGLLNVSLGGAPIEAFMGRELFVHDKEALKIIEASQSDEEVKKQQRSNAAAQEAWHDSLEKNDIGWKLSDSLWKKIQVPVLFRDTELAGFCGTVWLRKKFILNADMAEREGWIFLGTMVDSDKTYINRVLVGETGYQYPPRKYRIPKGLLKSGENEIRIRLVCDHGAGRITPGKRYKVLVDEQEISLEGEWEYQVGCDSCPAPFMEFITRRPTGLYNAMVAPCIPYTVKGVLWYQGESNDNSPDTYQELLKKLILFFRKQWNQQRLPFLVAQLPGFSIDLDLKGEAWPKIREAQAKAEMLPDVAVTINLDIGESNDLHPLNKKEVARRMALAAKGMIYGADTVYKGPRPQNWKVLEKAVMVEFDTGDGRDLIVSNGDGGEAFALAGENGRFYPAKGTVKGSQVILESSQVEMPVYLRYAFDNAPDKGLLFNHQELPAAPFCLCVLKEREITWGTQLFNDGWLFLKQPLNTSHEEADIKKNQFKAVGIPHDWLIYQGSDLYEDSTGWYKKSFFWSQKEDCQVFFRFDGIYMDSEIYINGEKAGEWKYGYSAFEVEVTSKLKEGVNEIEVMAHYQAPNSRWYSGAGIYRSVWAKVLHKNRILSDGVYASARKDSLGHWFLNLCTEVVTDCSLRLQYFLIQKNTEKMEDTKWENTGKWNLIEECAVQPEEGVQKVISLVNVNEPVLWDIEQPVCYELKAVLLMGEEILQEECLTIGFRTTEFNPDMGFLLNGKKVKLQGVCEHHDLGCLGAAYHSQAMARKFKILKKMGVNAVRLAHNMPAQDVMELADQMGILIVSEGFDMWERPKTQYDYSRFFKEWHERDMESWIRRDRNHPSLIMWSIGNEIYDTHAGERGLELTRLLKEQVRNLDFWENGAVTISSNYMPWENAQRCADLLKLAGYNYSDKYYEEHHKRHPDWIIYGSETGATVQSRGIYHFPYEQSVLADEDGQCSSLGNSTTSWGAKSAEKCIITERDHDFSCGQFLWSGFDYIGEPSPYHTRNSYFGQVDTAGFPKDSYYIYQAEWTDWRKNPMVHIFPYWDFNEGQIIDVRVCSNAPQVELFLNDESQGIYRIDHENGQTFSGHWKLPYRPGILKALAYDEKGRVIAKEIRSSFGEAEEIYLQADKREIQADGQELVFVTVSMKDGSGNPVENANNRVFVSVLGSGRLAGLDNGDSTDEDEYKGSSRRLFSGKLLLVAAAGTEPGDLKITVTSPGLRPACLVLPVLPGRIMPGASALAYGIPETEEGSRKADWEIPVRAIKLSSSQGTKLTPDHKTAVVSARLCPENASDRDIFWSVVNDAGIPSNLAELQEQGFKAVVTAKSDGHFRLRCMSRCNTEHIRIISTLEFTVEGFGEAFLNPYEFVCAGLFDYSRGEVGNGNEHGVATARDGETWVGFQNLDFGSYGSDEITISIFALTDEPYRLRIYEGIPGEKGEELVADVQYQKPSIWNTYQEETYRLNHRLTGISSLCFVLENKVHIKGFFFTRKNRAFEKLPVTDCDQIYGDHYIQGEKEIQEIGNNVSILFQDMEFGKKGSNYLTVCGYTPNDTCTILVRFLSEGKEETRLVEFKHFKEAGPQSFLLERISGTKTAAFVFLPGSNFDFKWFQFGDKDLNALGRD